MSHVPFIAVFIPLRPCWVTGLSVTLIGADRTPAVGMAAPPLVLVPGTICFGNHREINEWKTKDWNPLVQVEIIIFQATCCFIITASYPVLKSHLILGDTAETRLAEKKVWRSILRQS